MLNIVKQLKKKEIIRTHKNKGNSIRVVSRNIPANKEWVNSIYNFDKNKIRFLPAVHNYVFELLKGYFNLVNGNAESKITTKKEKMVHRLSTAKVWVSTPEIKHFSDKLYITVYVYNRIYNIYKQKLHLFKEDLLFNKKIIVGTKRKVVVKRDNLALDSNFNLSKYPIDRNSLGYTKKNISKSRFNTFRMYSTNNTSNSLFRKIEIHSNITNVMPNKNYVNKTVKVIGKFKSLKSVKRTYPAKKYDNNKYYASLIKWLKLDKLTLLSRYKSQLLSVVSNKQEWTDRLKNLNTERHNYLINQFKKELTYISFKQNMLFNQFKFKELYLAPIIGFLQSIYRKKVVINIVALKYYHLNTSILSQIIVRKLKKAKYRGISLKVVDAATSEIKIPVLGTTKFPRIENKFISMQNIILDNFETTNENKDCLQQFLLTKNAKLSKSLHKSILKNLENKVVSGIFIKISGRLTKRYKAERARSTLRSKGTLKNVYSAHKGFSSNLSRGFSNINVEKTMTHSKTRVGAYGLTGWIASY